MLTFKWTKKLCLKKKSPKTSQFLGWTVIRIKKSFATKKSAHNNFFFFFFKCIQSKIEVNISFLFKRKIWLCYIFRENQRKRNEKCPFLASFHDFLVGAWNSSNRLLFSGDFNLLLLDGWVFFFKFFYFVHLINFEI